MHVRILVAMYLFMTGYGHFSYFWQKKDLSFYRVFNVSLFLLIIRYAVLINIFLIQ